MNLHPVVPDMIWHAQQPIKFGPLSITTRATFVRLNDGSIWVHSPIAPTRELLEEVIRIGPVRHVVAPNKSHHLFFAAFVEACPGACGYLAPGLKEKRPELSSHVELDDVSARSWEPELLPCFIDGIPALNETVWFHEKSGTLIAADLLFCFGDHNSASHRFLARLLGVQSTMRMSRTMKLLVKDKAALAEVARQLLKLDVRRVVLAHDQIIEGNAKEELAAAFAWLMKYRRD